MRVTVEVGQLAPPAGTPVVVGVVVEVPDADALHAIEAAEPAIASVRMALEAAGYSSETTHVTAHREPSWTTSKRDRTRSDHPGGTMGV